jgi:RNA polymerase sigma-70 factor (ECF subfamily)
MVKELHLQSTFGEWFYQAFMNGNTTQEDCRLFLEYLYRRHRSVVFLFIFRRLRWTELQHHVREPYQEAEDLCHETFCRAFQWLLTRIGANIKKVNERAWLLEIAANLIKDKRRNQRGNPLPGSAGSESETETLIVDPGRLPLDVVIWQELKEKLRQCLEKLTDLRRKALQLVDLDELSESEAAEQMNTQVETLRKRLFDARRQLRECMNVYYVGA